MVFLVQIILCVALSCCLTDVDDGLSVLVAGEVEGHLLVSVLGKRAGGTHLVEACAHSCIDHVDAVLGLGELPDIVGHIVLQSSPHALVVCGAEHCLLHIGGHCSGIIAFTCALIVLVGEAGDDAVIAIGGQAVEYFALAVLGEERIHLVAYLLCLLLCLG